MKKKGIVIRNSDSFFFWAKNLKLISLPFFVFFFFETPFPIAFEDLLRLSSFEALLGSFVGNVVFGLAQLRNALFAYGVQEAEFLGGGNQ